MRSVSSMRFEPCVQVLMLSGKQLHFDIQRESNRRSISIQKRNCRCCVSEEIRKEDELSGTVAGKVPPHDSAQNHDFRANGGHRIEAQCQILRVIDFCGGGSSPPSQRLIWMRQQADRLDPLVESPPSVLDHRHEIRRW